MAQVYRFTDDNGQVRLFAEIDPVPGVPPVSVVASFSSVDAHAAGTYPLKIGGIVDNEWDFNALSALPAGLGLSFAFDGSSANITTTAAGVWAFSLFVSLSQDAAFVGYVTLPFTGFGSATSAIDATAVNLGTDETIALPSGATSSAVLSTVTGATANPYAVFGSLSIVRFA